MQQSTVIDHAGREVRLDLPVRSIYCTSPAGSILVYTVAPDLLIGWNVTLTAIEREFLEPKYLDLPVLGGWFGKNTTGNVEEILKADPDVIISMGQVDQTAVSVVEGLSGQLKKPVVMIDGSLDKLPEAYELVGQITGSTDVAGQLASYCRATLDEAERKAAGIAEQDRITVYYAEGPEGLQTEPSGSSRTRVLELVGGRNIAQMEATQGAGGMSPVSLEQVIAWDSDVILVGSDPGGEYNVHQKILTGNGWSGLRAVKARRVYQIPHGPFNWFDRPESVNRIFGVRWLGNLLYPDVFPYDIRSEATDFYKLFYHVDLTAAHLDTLLERSCRTQ